MFLKFWFDFLLNLLLQIFSTVELILNLQINKPFSWVVNTGTSYLEGPGLDFYWKAGFPDKNSSQFSGAVP
jgi:hypothetical protein